jgi:hypothetical protein
MKNPNVPIENQTRDLPACRAVPQPSASLRTQIKDNSGSVCKLRGSFIKYNFATEELCNWRPEIVDQCPGYETKCWRSHI